MKRLLERLQGLWRHRSEHPASIWLFRHPVGAARIDPVAITMRLCLFAEQTNHPRLDVGHRYAIPWHEGIQIDQLSNSLRHPISHSADAQPSKTVTHQHDTLHILYLPPTHCLFCLA